LGTEMKKNLAVAVALGIGAAMPFAGIASAADQAMPRKAPVQYVKICSLYGEGFYYIPGSDTCLRIGGYVRAQYEYNSGDEGIVLGSGVLAAQGLRTRATNRGNFATRINMTADARTQTAYGTLRAYTSLIAFRASGLITDTPAQDLFVQRAFIQWAGFTIGHARSFFDHFALRDNMSYFNIRTTGDTNDDGINLFAYTAQFGNGFVASVSFEESWRKEAIVDASVASFAVNGTVTRDNAGQRAPDIIGSLRYEQTWGYVGVSGAAHQVRAAMYGAAPNVTTLAPDDKWGWAGSASGQLNLPNGDTFGVNAVYSRGAVAYATRGGSWQLYNGSGVGLGWITDAIFQQAPLANVPGYDGSLLLTTAWSINAGYDHRWNESWRTSLYGGYTAVRYNATAERLINSHLPGAAGTIQCGAVVAGAVFPPITMTNGGAENSCSPDFSFYQIGSRTEFSPVHHFALGVDVLYTRLNTAYEGVGTYPVNGTRPTQTRLVDQDIWSAMFRAQYKFNQ
jgi:hypothetical protein